MRYGTVGTRGSAPGGQHRLCDNITTFDCGPVAYYGNVRIEVSSQYGIAARWLHVYASPDTVVRASAGKYTQPTETAFEQYVDQSGKRAASFDFAQFWVWVSTRPGHDNPVQYSNNYDFSLEHHLHNTDVTMKVSPFYRDTHNEIVSVVLGPGFVSGVNVGHQNSLRR